jgi:hypothetical protein
VWLGVCGDPLPLLQPSAAALQLMDAACRALPDLRWRCVLLVGGVEEGLLQDEVQEVETAAVVIIEAGMPVGPDTSMDTSMDESRDAFLAMPLNTSMDTSTDTSIEARTPAHHAPQHDATAAAAMALDAPLCRYRVAAVPGLRVRATPSLSAPRVGVLRTGQVVRGAAAAVVGWVALDRGGFTLSRQVRAGPAPTGAAASAAPLLSLIDANDETDADTEDDTEGEDHPSPRYSSAGGGGALSAGRTAASRAQGLPGGGRGAVHAASGREAAEPKRRAEARDAAACAARRDDARRNAAMTAARALLGGVHGSAVHAAHCSGAVLIAVGPSVELLSQPDPTGASGARPGFPRRPPSRRWPHLCSFLLRPPREAAWRDGRRAAAWRHLRGAAVRSRLEDSFHGFAAVGIPPGCIAEVITADRFALRVALGSTSQPCKLSLSAAEAAEARRAARQDRLRRDAERWRMLAAIAAELDRVAGGAGGGGAAGGSLPADERDRPAVGIDFEGKPRGQCPACNACPGYAIPFVVTDHRLVMHCRHCGCLASAHEELKQASTAGEG